MSDKALPAISVRIPAQIRRLYGMQSVEQVRATTVSGLIAVLEERYPGIGERLLEPDGQLRRWVNLFVDGEDIRSLEGVATQFQDGEEVYIVPSVAGGGEVMEKKCQFLAVHPVLPVRNVRSAIDYYVRRLGFHLLFQDRVEEPSAKPPLYAGVGRDSVELHLQWHDEDSFDVVEKLSLRFAIADIDALFADYQQQNVFHDATALRETAWGTREFAFYDPDGNGLTFYCDLE